MLNRYWKVSDRIYIKHMADDIPPLGSLEPSLSSKETTSKHLFWLAGKALSGFAFAVFFVCALMLFNIANLRDLIMSSNDKWVALFILTFFLGLTFGSVQMGIAIMNRFGKDDDDDNDKPGRGPKLPDLGGILQEMLAPTPQRKPVKVRATRLY